MKKMNSRHLPIFILCVIFSSCSTSVNQEVIVKKKFMMDTLVEITVAEPDKPKAARAIEEAFKEIKRIEKITSPVGNNDLSRLNEEADKNPVEIPEDLFFIIDRGLYFSRLTGGVFDITVGPLVKLWGFDDSTKKNILPAKEAVNNALEFVGYRNVIIDDKRHTVFFTKKGVAIDLGGIAKGYIVGRAMEVLKKAGIKNAIVNAGGDIKVIGNKFGNKWKIGIKHPRKADELLDIIEIEGARCIFTSGDYERCFFVSNKRYHHILNPKTGYPADSSVVSATIICGDELQAQVLAKVIIIEGSSGGRKFINKFTDTEAILSTDKGNVEQLIPVVNKKHLKNTKNKYLYRIIGKRSGSAKQ